MEFLSNLIKRPKSLAANDSDGGVNDSGLAPSKECHSLLLTASADQPGNGNNQCEVISNCEISSNSAAGVNDTVTSKEHMPASGTYSNTAIFDKTNNAPERAVGKVPSEQKAFESENNTINDSAENMANHCFSEQIINFTAEEIDCLLQQANERRSCCQSLLDNQYNESFLQCEIPSERFEGCKEDLGLSSKMEDRNQKKCNQTSQATNSKSSADKVGHRTCKPTGFKEVEQYINPLLHDTSFTDEFLKDFQFETNQTHLNISIENASKADYREVTAGNGKHFCSDDKAGGDGSLNRNRCSVQELLIEINENLSLARETYLPNYRTLSRSHSETLFPQVSKNSPQKTDPSLQLHSSPPVETDEVITPLPDKNPCGSNGNSTNFREFEIINVVGNFGDFYHDSFDSRRKSESSGFMEYDERKIPDLPEGFDIKLEDEGMLKSEFTTGSYETDTTASSDNEVFIDCPLFKNTPLKSNKACKAIPETDTINSINNSSNKPELNSDQPIPIQGLNTTQINIPERQCEPKVVIDETIENFKENTTLPTPCIEARIDSHTENPQIYDAGEPMEVDSEYETLDSSYTRNVTLSIEEKWQNYGGIENAASINSTDIAFDKSSALPNVENQVSVNMPISIDVETANLTVEHQKISSAKENENFLDCKEKVNITPLHDSGLLQKCDNIDFRSSESDLSMANNTYVENIAEKEAIQISHTNLELTDFHSPHKISANEFSEDSIIPIAHQTIELHSPTFPVKNRTSSQCFPSTPEKKLPLLIQPTDKSLDYQESFDNIAKSNQRAISTEINTTNTFKDKVHNDSDSETTSNDAPNNEHGNTSFPLSSVTSPASGRQTFSVSTPFELSENVSVSNSENEPTAMDLKKSQNKRRTFNIVTSEQDAATAVTEYSANVQDQFQTSASSNSVKASIDEKCSSMSPETENEHFTPDLNNKRRTFSIECAEHEKSHKEDYVGKPPDTQNTAQIVEMENVADAQNLAIKERFSAGEPSLECKKSEKDDFVENISLSTRDIFGTGADISNNTSSEENKNDFDEDFSGNNIILNPCDFDYLLTKGNSQASSAVDRSSLLLKFDPLIGVSLPVNHQPSSQRTFALNPTFEDIEQENNNNSGFKKPKAPISHKITKRAESKALFSKTVEEHVTMSVDVMKDINTENNTQTQADDKKNNFDMDDHEKKIKNEVCSQKTDELERKLKQAELREEQHIRRISEKDKNLAKMSEVMEAYEKAIAELISEKERQEQNYEKQLSELKADRDLNYNHLMSLEATFSDLHIKYEKCKEIILALKASEEQLLTERKQNLESLKQQETRYDKMKSHAMQQLDFANTKLETLSKEHATETIKMRAMIKKEEIRAAAIAEQLEQKRHENAELVKMCDELINSQGS